MQGSMIKEIFDRFCDAEFRADWDAARAEFGDAVTTNDLERTDTQRRMDALFAVFRQAASTTTRWLRPSHGAEPGDGLGHLSTRALPPRGWPPGRA